MRIDGNITSEPSELLSAWATHFQQLSESEIPDSDPIKEDIQPLWSSSFTEDSEDLILDVPITAEEVEDALSSLKRRKSPGPDGVCNEHLLFGGPVVKAWLLQVYNAIIYLESIPSL